MEPTVMMAARCLIAVPPMFAFLAWRSGAGRAVRQLQAAWRPGLILGVGNAAVPFFLIAWGEKHIDSGVAAIAQASVPLFNTAIAWRFMPAERAKGLRLVGLGVGLVGVAI